MTSLIDVDTSVEIARPRYVVYEYAANPDNAPSWYVNIKAVRWLTTRPLQLGSRIAFVAHFLGHRLEYTYEIVELVPLVRLVMRTAEGPFPMETTYRFEDTVAGSTRMWLRNRGAPRGFARILMPFMRRAITRANRKDLMLLKQVLEGGRGSDAEG